MLPCTADAFQMRAERVPLQIRGISETGTHFARTSRTSREHAHKGHHMGGGACDEWDARRAPPLPGYWMGVHGDLLGLCLSFTQNRENFVFFFRASAPKFRETFAKFLRISHTHSHLLGRLRPHGTIASSAQCGGSWQHPPPRAPILRSAALVRQDGAMAVLPIGRWIQELKLRFPLLLRRSNPGFQ